MIILNLVQNAINAMPTGGELEIKTNTNKEDILISIKDNGCGIPQKDIQHIFEPFYSTSNFPEKKGTGLGLAIVKDLTLKISLENSKPASIELTYVDAETNLTVKLIVKYNY